MTTNYEEIQNNEIEVLQSIFGDEFVRKQDALPRAAWNKAAPPAFSILVSVRDSDLSINLPTQDLPCLTLVVHFSATYPRSLPQIEIGDYANLAKHDIDKILRDIQQDAKRLLGNEMIYDLVQNVKAQLLDRLRQKLQPSLGDERDARLARLTKQRTTAELDGEADKAAAHQESQTILHELIIEDLKAKEVITAPDESSLVQRELTPDISISFARPLQLRQFRGRPVETISLGIPLTESDKSSMHVFCTHVSGYGRLIIKRILGTLPFLRTIEPMFTVSPNLSKACAISNCGTSIAEDQGQWTLYLVQEHAVHGSLRDVLNTVGTVSLSQAKRWLLDLAEQLVTAHRTGVTHRNIIPSKVVLTASDGRLAACLVDFNYSYILHKQNVYFEAENVNSVRSTGHEPSGRKSDDIASLGILFMQMLYGIKACSGASSIDRLLKADKRSRVQMTDFVSELLSRDSSKRPTAGDLLSSEFLTNFDDNQVSDALRDTSRGKVTRYQADFEELATIGRGGFGVVTKARNRLDGECLCTAQAN